MPIINVNKARWCVDNTFSLSHCPFSAYQSHIPPQSQHPPTNKYTQISQQGGASTPGGDSLGGDIFYTATTALSLPFPGIRYLADNNCRLFCFANAGTLAGSLCGPSINNPLTLRSFLDSSRTSVGWGTSVGTPIGRVEVTYAVPLRYGPRDARKSVQAGVGLNFG